MTTKIKYGLIGLVIGFIIGYLVTSGTLYYSTTKSQKGDFTENINLISAIICAVIGMIIMVNVASEAVLEAKLGFNNIVEGMFQTAGNGLHILLGLTLEHLNQ